jgi:succinate dehydrogenase / fumarate reductase cytochrome b subunit
MELSRRVGFFQGLKYQGRSTMIHWMLHRITGLSILLFVGLHVLADFFMQQTGGEFATAINRVYESPIFQIFIVFAVLFHALNGVRIALLDLWPRFQNPVDQHRALWLQWAVFLPLFGMTVLFLVRQAIGGA